MGRNTKKRQLILVTGLSHSGTTILDAALGCAPEAVGIGEALTLVFESNFAGGNAKRLVTGESEQVFCTCNVSAATCPVWSHVTAKPVGPSDQQGVFDDIYEAALAAHPEASVILDSSPAGWSHVGKLKKYDIKAIVLTRDVRSWVASHQRRSEMHLSKSFARWRRGAKRPIEELAKSQIPILKIGYEEFALKPEGTLRLICEHFGLTYTDAMLCPHDNTGSHIITGNQQVRNKHLASEIRYDGRWMSSAQDPWMSGFLFALHAKQNAELVYSNNLIQTR